jgi:hypothetical protein
MRRPLKILAKLSDAHTGDGSFVALLCWPAWSSSLEDEFQPAASANDYPTRFRSDFKLRFLIRRCRYLGWIPNSLAASI